MWKVPIDNQQDPERAFDANKATVHNMVSAIKGNVQGMAVFVQSGLNDEIRRLEDANGGAIYSSQTEISTWDYKVLENGHRVLVIGTSSSDHPSELYSVDDGDKLIAFMSHNAEIAKLDLPTSKAFYTTAKDGTRLQSILFQPLGVPAQPWKTIVLVHGGPMMRINLTFSRGALGSLGPLLASAGYAVLFPNYRGSSAQGDDFQTTTRGAVGTLHYEDIVSIVEAGIEDGFIDREYVAIGGWSQGGFLSYLFVTRDTLKFRAAVCGAGITDWDSLIMTSDFTAAEADMAGRAHWDAEPNDVSMRHASAIWRISKIKTPILILHGEKDERVPVSQAKAFYRGCLEHGVNCKTALYPGEPHDIAEREHVVDMLSRIKLFYDEHMDN